MLQNENYAAACLGTCITPGSASLMRHEARVGEKQKKVNGRVEWKRTFLLMIGAGTGPCPCQFTREAKISRVYNEQQER